MKEFLCSYKAEFIKNKHSIFLYIHIGIPFIFVGLLTFIYFSRIGNLNSLGLFATFFQMISFAFPLLIAVLCGLIANQEEHAARYQIMLCKTPHKITAFISQLCMMLTMCFASILLSIIIFIISMKFILHVKSIDYFLFFKTGVLIFLSVIFLYVLYLTLAYYFGIGVCNIVGFAGVIIAGLASTGQGDSIWMFLPWVWPARFTNFIITFQFKDMSKVPIRYISYTNGGMNTGLFCMGIMTICCIAFSAVSFYFWEGRQK